MKRTDLIQSADLRKGPLWGALLLVPFLWSCGDDDDPDAPETDAAAQPDAGETADAEVPCSVEPPSEGDCLVDSESLAIEGEYTDDFGSSWSIDGCAINGDRVLTFSNDEQYLISQNSCEAFNPAKYSRNDWTIAEVDGVTSLLLCTIAYDKDTAAEAEAEESSDPDDLEAGCNGFSWSNLGAYGPAETVDGGAPDGGDEPFSDAGGEDGSVDPSSDAGGEDGSVEPPGDAGTSDAG